MILSGGKIVTDKFTLENKNIKIEGNIISDISENCNDDNVVDVSGMYVLPGFIDTHLHGACGERIEYENANINKITRFEVTKGVTGIALCTASSEFSQLLLNLEKAKKASEECEGCKILAIHAEGPFLSDSKKGAMNAENLVAPDAYKFDEMLKASGGLIRIMTISPEMDGAMQVIEYVQNKGICVSMGHTNADFDTAKMAIDKGARRMTHTFNASRAINHREPGVVVAALNDDRVTCEVICDFVHLHPEIVKLIYKMKGKDGMCIISDSSTAAGIEVSEFEVNGVKRYVKNGVVTLADGTIAGSTRTILDGVKNLVSLGIPLEDVSKMASFVPARDLKMDDKLGSLKEGKLADIVVLDKNLDVVYTFVNGKCVYKRDEK